MANTDIYNGYDDITLATCPSSNETINVSEDVIIYNQCKPQMKPIILRKELDEFELKIELDPKLEDKEGADWVTKTNSAKHAAMLKINVKSKEKLNALEQETLGMLTSAEKTKAEERSLWVKILKVRKIIDANGIEKVSGIYSENWKNGIMEFSELPGAIRKDGMDIEMTYHRGGDNSNVEFNTIGFIPRGAIAFKTTNSITSTSAQLLSVVSNDSAFADEEVQAEFVGTSEIVFLNQNLQPLGVISNIEVVEGETAEIVYKNVPVELTGLGVKSGGIDAVTGAPKTTRYIEIRTNHIPSEQNASFGWVDLAPDKAIFEPAEVVLRSTDETVV